MNGNVPCASVRACVCVRVCSESGVCGELFNSGDIAIMAESAEKTAGASVCQELRARLHVSVWRLREIGVPAG